MPEGHTLQRLARQFTSVFAGQALAVSSPQGRFAAGAARLDGHVLTRADAHGKHLFLHFDNDLILRVHLGLYGAWDFGGDESFRGASSIGAPRRVGEAEIGDDDGGRPYAGPPEPVGAVRVRLVSEHGWADLRGPIACEVITEAEAAVVRSILGPDPLREDADPAEFIRRVRAKKSPIGLLLMNQDIIAGVGNVYRAEVLFRQRLNPWRLGSALTEDEVGALWNEVVAAMQDGVREGRIITTDPTHRSAAGDESGGPEGAAEGEPGRPKRAAGDESGGTKTEPQVATEDAHYVYKRTGLPCRICGTTIEMAEMGTRKLYWCPTDQAA